MKTFATEKHPIRASSLYKLLECPLSQVLKHKELVGDTAGTAAETGSLVHAGVETFHKTKSMEKALATLRDESGRFPKADLSEAEKHLRPYTKDPRNQKAEIVAMELAVKFKLQEDLSDRYGPIFVTGHLDQIRLEDGRLVLWDVKTGSRLGGWEMLQVATVQLAAYCVGASQYLDAPVYPGGIIRTYGYRVRGAKKPEEEPTGVFFHASWDLEHVQKLLSGVALRVAEIRRGVYTPVPGEHCVGCGAGSLEGCLPLLQQLEVRK